MNLAAILRRCLRRRLLLLLFVNSFGGVAMAAETACIDGGEYGRLTQRYVDLFSKFDLTSVAQEYVDVSVDAEDLNEDVKACWKNIPGPDQQQCDALAKQYDAKVSRLKDIEHRFYAALNLQEYLLTLKLKLEQPRCEK